MSELTLYQATRLRFNGGEMIASVTAPWTVVHVDEFERVTAEREALQQLLNAADQRIDKLVAELAKVRLGPCKMIVGVELP